MKNRIKFIIIAALLIGISIGGYFIFGVEKLDFEYSPKLYSNDSESKETLSFVQNKLSDEFGVYTNYLDKANTGDLTKGHYILSESEGIMMQYAVETNNKDLFDNHFNHIDNMMMKNGLVSWRYKEDDKSNVSSTIDELRILRSLALAYKNFGDSKYKDMYFEIANGLKKYSYRDGYLVDFNENGNLNNTVTLSYMDLPTLKILGEVDSDFEKVYYKAKALVEGGLISSEVPLYRKNYNLDTKKYSEDETNELLLTALIYLYKADIGEDVSSFTDWTKKNLDEFGYLCGLYDNSGKPANNIESTAVYSTVAMVARSSGDMDLYNRIIERMSLYKINSGEFTGGFGMEESKEFYSFDNLMALLALLK